jgi:enterochelin esterase-like enzyme
MRHSSDRDAALRANRPSVRWFRGRLDARLPVMSTAEIHEPSPKRLGGRAAGVLAALAASLTLVGAGLVGAFHYLDNFWLYRGFPPPRDAAYVRVVGVAQQISVVSPALGGRSQPVQVYLPPGYAAHPAAHYPVMSLLHGFPGRPGAFLQTVQMGVVEDELLAKHRIRPFILVMPFGSTGTFTDKEWANGVGKGEGWETFVARDLVRAIDARYRTIRSGADRVLAGLSEGGYGSLNIGLHHPHEFRVLESWSGYETAANLKSIFGGNKARLAANSPLVTLAKAAPTLRRTHAYVWLYSGTTDSFNTQNQAFAALLAKDRVAHHFRLIRGGHNWAIWRAEAANSLLIASAHIGSSGVSHA